MSPRASHTHSHFCRLEQTREISSRRVESSVKVGACGLFVSRGGLWDQRLCGLLKQDHQGQHETPMEGPFSWKRHPENQTASWKQSQHLWFFLCVCVLFFLYSVSAGLEASQQTCTKYRFWNIFNFHKMFYSFFLILLCVYLRAESDIVMILFLVIFVSPHSPYWHMQVCEVIGTHSPHPPRHSSSSSCLRLSHLLENRSSCNFQN